MIAASELALAPSQNVRRGLAWAAAVVFAAVVTCWAMYQEIATFGQKAPIETGLDFANNTWRAVRGLIAGQNVYAAGTRIPGIGHVGPVAEHVPATLTWEAPFAALPQRPALFAFTFASLLATWAGVLILTKPRAPQDAMLAVCCGALAILAGGGPWTLLLGQPTGFILLGVALVVRARRPWVAAVGFVLAASTIQVGLPFALALMALRQWRTVWRGVVVIAALSLPPVLVGALNAGSLAFAGTFADGGADRLGRTSNRIDLGALLHRAGVHSTAVQVGVGVTVLVMTLWFLGRLPASLRRIEYPPVLYLVIAAILLCTYHQNYDMLLVGGAVVPTALLGARSVAMFPIFGLAGISAALPGKSVAVVVDPLFLMAIAVLSALAARRGAASETTDSPGSIGSELISARVPVAAGGG